MNQGVVYTRSNWSRRPRLKQLLSTGDVGAWLGKCFSLASVRRDFSGEVPACCAFYGLPRKMIELLTPYWHN